MSAEDNGGPAFPAPNAGVEHFGDCSAYMGLSLRDYFAAHAPMTAQDMPLDDHCAYRFRYADAMLAARAKS